jgi:hypothetical protein
MIAWGQLLGNPVPRRGRVGITLVGRNWKLAQYRGLRALRLVTRGRLSLFQP